MPVRNPDGILMADKYAMDGRACLNSDEFRTFAMRWLGFDPLDRDHCLGLRSINVHIPHDGPVEFDVRMLALTEKEEG